MTPSSVPNSALWPDFQPQTRSPIWPNTLNEPISSRFWQLLTKDWPKTVENSKTHLNSARTQRALRSKKFNPDRKFQSWLDMFNLDRKFQSRSKTSILRCFYLRGPPGVAEKGSIENFNPRSIARNVQSIACKMSPFCDENSLDKRAPKATTSELFAMGPVQFSDAAESPKIRLLNLVLGNILSIFPRKNSKIKSSLNFLQSGPRKFTKSDFRDWPRSGEFWQKRTIMDEFASLLRP